MSQITNHTIYKIFLVGAKQFVYGSVAGQS